MIGKEDPAGLDVEMSLDLTPYTSLGLRDTPKGETRKGDS